MLPVTSGSEDINTLLSSEIEGSLVVSILHPLRSALRVRPVAKLNRGVELVAFSSRMGSYRLGRFFALVLSFCFL